jgi:hypothetical protein
VGPAEMRARLMALPHIMQGGGKIALKACLGAGNMPFISASAVVRSPIVAASANWTRQLPRLRARCTESRAR